MAPDSRELRSGPAHLVEWSGDPGGAAVGGRRRLIERLARPTSLGAEIVTDVSPWGLPS